VAGTDRALELRVSGKNSDSCAGRGCRAMDELACIFQTPNWNTPHNFATAIA